MFIPNVKCVVRRRLGTDLYGKPTYHPPVTVMCGLVRLEEQSDPTGVRADSSASRGSARESTTLARVLFPASVELEAGDAVKVLKFDMTVQSTWPRFAVSGRLDHWQVDLEILQD